MSIKHLELKRLFSLLGLLCVLTLNKKIPLYQTPVSLCCMIRFPAIDFTTASLSNFV